MLYDEEMQGHDSQLEGVMIDVLRRTVSLRLSSFPTQDASNRVAIEVTFSDVEAVHTIADLTQLGDHHGAGNVNYWHVAEGPGTSYFHLIEGCLVITAHTAPTLSFR